MKLCVTFLLILVILPSVTGKKSSEHTPSDAALRGERGTCSPIGQQCIDHDDCCGTMCCMGGNCGVPVYILPCHFNS
uniref:Conotoxin superfamily I1 n=1 Tax=Conus magus TaxID=6492 RepID=A0A679PD88_CONMA|nr:TPA_inf: conotoxin superfamily I1 [Conus magus]